MRKDGEYKQISELSNIIHGSFRDTIRSDRICAGICRVPNNTIFNDYVIFSIFTNTAKRYIKIIKKSKIYFDSSDNKLYLDTIFNLYFR